MRSQRNSHSFYDEKQRCCDGESKLLTKQIKIDLSTKMSSKEDNNFLATLTRLQNVGRKLEEWLKQDTAHLDTGVRFCASTSTPSVGFAATGDQGTMSGIEADIMKQKAVSETVLSSINLSDSFTSIRGTMSHGLSPDFQLPSEEIR